MLARSIILKQEIWHLSLHLLEALRCLKINVEIFVLKEMLIKVAQNSNISVRSLGSNAPFSAGNHAITRGFVR